MTAMLTCANVRKHKAFREAPVVSTPTIQSYEQSTHSDSLSALGAVRGVPIGGMMSNEALLLRNYSRKVLRLDLLQPSPGAPLQFLRLLAVEYDLIERRAW